MLPRLPISLPAIRRGLVGALREIEQRVIGPRSRAHGVVVDEKLPDILAVGRAPRAHGDAVDWGGAVLPIRATI